MASTVPRPDSRPDPRGGAPANPSRARNRSVLATVAGLPLSLGGLVLVFAGAVLQAVAILGSTWVAATVNGTTVRFGFGDLSQRTQRGLAYAYFAYGAWLLLLVSLGLGIGACVHWKGARTLRFVGAVVSVLASFVTIAAVLTFAHQSHDPLFRSASHYAVGIYLAMLGLLACALGSAAGGWTTPDPLRRPRS